jgi:hypothetical protein
MSRETYDILTDATAEVLGGNAKTIAIGWDKCPQYIYDIAKGDRKDPYAYFRSIYEGTLRGGVSTEAWDDDMARLRARYAGQTGVDDVSIQQLHKEAFEAIDALLENKSHAECAAELRELIAVAQLKLEGVEKLGRRLRSVK